MGVRLNRKDHDGLWHRTQTNINNITFRAPSTGGFVGIGVSEPEDKLHVSGEKRPVSLILETESPGSTNTPAHLITRTFANLDTSNSTGALWLQTAQGTKAHPSPVPAARNIGAIYAAAYDGFSFQDASGNGNGPAIKFETAEPFSKTNHGSRLLFSTVANGTNQNLNRLTIDQNGFIGIGTTRPIHLFNIYQPVTDNWENGNPTGTVDLAIGKNCGDNSRGDGNGGTCLGIYRTANGGGHVGLTVVKSGGSAPGNMVLNYRGGDVGINTNNPSENLSIGRSIVHNRSCLELGNGVANKEVNAGKICYQGWSNGLDIVGAGPAVLPQQRRIQFWSEAGATFVGPVTGNNELFINGTGQSKFAGSLKVDGVVTALDLVATSDARLKTDIAPIENALEKVLRLRGVHFAWNNKIKNNQRQIGFIAQEVESVFPEVVSTNEQGFKAISYGNLTAPLVEAVKELNQQNEVLEEKLGESFETRRRLESRLERLERKLSEVTKNEKK